jgi:Flp pilus assembly protein TadD
MQGDILKTAESLFFTGIELHQKNEYAAAEAAFRDCLSLVPGRSSVLSNLIACLISQKKFSEAQTILSSALKSHPNDPQLLHHQAILAHHNNQLEVALDFVQNALEETPNNPIFLNTLGSIQRSLRNYPDAKNAYQRALELDNNYHEAATNLGYLLLGRRNFAKGWKLIEARFQKSVGPVSIPSALSHLPVWDGIRSINSILIHAEQGFGDSLQFCRFLQRLPDQISLVTFLVQPELRRLMQNNLDPRIQVIDSVDAIDHTKIDCRAALLSLPRLLNLNQPSDLKTPAYLHTSASITSTAFRPNNHKTRLGGLAWRGNPKLPADKKRSISLEQFESLFAIEDILWVSLVLPEHSHLDRTSCTNPLQQVLSLDMDFQDTAEQIQGLDFVVSVDTAIAHLAGAMGKQVFLLNRYESEWRWGFPPEQNSLWYENVQLLNQFNSDDWSHEIEQLHRLLT